MKTAKFRVSHLLLGAALLVLVEAILVRTLPFARSAEIVIFLASVIGSAMTLYVSVEAIEEVRSRSHVLAFLSLIVLEFIAFFAFQYAFLLLVQPASFPTLAPDAVSLLLHSTMIFLFNPLYAAGTSFGRGLMLVNTLAALGLVLFILQNAWQLRTPKTVEQ